jgi:pimeloyl-ACP methyl ester carboxylesterase
MKLQRGRVSLWLEPLHEGTGTTLLLLHELGGSSADFGDGSDLEWSGPIHALDFSGHGRSGRMLGGSYSPEQLAADADAAVVQLGGACVLGAGLGAYIALLLAGARPALVPGVALLKGRGITGGGASYDFSRPPRLAPIQSVEASSDLQSRSHVDPVALFCLGNDPRPDDYAPKFASTAKRVLLVDSESETPPWWRAVARVPGVTTLLGDRRAAARALAH